MMLAEFPTDVEDPVQRLKAARADMKTAKATSNALPIGLIQSASFFWPSALMMAGAKFMARPASRQAHPRHTVEPDDVERARPVQADLH